MTMNVSETEYTAIAVPVPVYEDRSAAADHSHGPPAAQAQPCLEVEAPATLPEGYAFEAKFNGYTFSVTVPAGGVKTGQKFVVPYPASTAGSYDSILPRTSVPVGRWKDELCDCCRFGCCHPVCCNAYFCQLILLGQIMTRLKLTWLGSEGTPAQINRTFRIMFILTVVWLSRTTIHSAVLNAIAPLDASGQPSKAYLVTLSVGHWLTAAFFVFVVCLASRTRRRIRQKYRIPGGGCDDCCTSFWCTCCTISQMARHTADYETYAGQCCSDTGLPPHAPALDDMSPPASSIV